MFPFLKDRQLSIEEQGFFVVLLYLWNIFPNELFFGALLIGKRLKTVLSSHCYGQAYFALFAMILLVAFHCCFFCLVFCAFVVYKLPGFHGVLNCSPWVPGKPFAENAGYKYLCGCFLRKQITKEGSVLHTCVLGSSFSCT